MTRQNPRFRFLALSTLLLAALSIALPASGQECSPDDIVLGSQSAVDHFQANHGPCDEVAGHLVVTGEDIVDLDGLSALDVIGGSLSISHNPRLTDIDGLAGVSDVAGHVTVWENGRLEDVDGLIGLRSVDGDLFVRDNHLLTDLEGLSRITRVGGDLGIESNGLVTHLAGLRRLSSVGGTFRLQREDLENIDGLAQLTSIGGKLVITNTTLTHVDGLSNLIHVGGDIWILVNPKLANLDGLASVNSALSLLVENNARLADCQGLIRLIDPIDHAAPGPGPGSAGVPDVAGSVEFHDNLEGCNSIFEVLGDVALFSINAGLNDAWFNPETPGQGFFIIVLPHLEQIFMAWFTYDTERPPSDVTAFLQEPGHRWLTAQGTYQGNSAELTVYITSGGVFDSPLPMPMAAADGEILLEFTECNAGTITYDIPSIDRQGVIPIERIAPDNIETCYLFGNPLPDAEAE